MDTIEGKVHYISSSEKEFREFIKQKDNIEQYLLSNLVYDLINRGLIPKENEGYSFTILPALGGKIEADNITVMDFIVIVSITGQIMRQVTNQPVGTEFGDFKISD